MELNEALQPRSKFKTNQEDKQMLDFITHPNEPVYTAPPRKIRVRQQRFRRSTRVLVRVLRTY